ncbi:MAG: hypothetical protein QM758_06510 [Armatimonas sp.]
MFPETNIDDDNDRWQALGAVAGALFGAFIGSEFELPGILFGALVGGLLGAFLLSVGYPARSAFQAPTKYRRRLRSSPATGARYHDLP